MKKLSIIIPCYNTAEYLPTCINSLKEQPYDDVEFIFINDGSKDNTLSIIRSFAESDSRVVIVDKCNAGVSAARNDAIEIANGEYIFLLDSDDYISPNALEIIYREIEKTHFDLLISNIVKVRNSIKYFQNHQIPAGIYKPSQIYCQCDIFPLDSKLVYKKEIINKWHIRFNTEIHVAEVYHFTLQFLQHINSINVIADSFYHYILQPNSAVHQPNYQKDITILQAINDIYTLNDKSITEQTSFHITNYSLVIGFSYLKYIKHNLHNKQAIDIIRQVLKNRNIKYCLYKTAFKKHKYIRYRLLSLYMLITSVWGYYVLVRVRKTFKK